MELRFLKFGSERHTWSPKAKGYLQRQDQVLIDQRDLATKVVTRVLSCLEVARNKKGSETAMIFVEYHEANRPGSVIPLV